MYPIVQPAMIPMAMYPGGAAAYMPSRRTLSISKVLETTNSRRTPGTRRRCERDLKASQTDLWGRSTSLDRNMKYSANNSMTSIPGSLNDPAEKLTFGMSPLNDAGGWGNRPLSHDHYNNPYTSSLSRPSALGTSPYGAGMGTAGLSLYGSSAALGTAGLSSYGASGAMGATGSSLHGASGAAGTMGAAGSSFEASGAMGTSGASGTMETTGADSHGASATIETAEGNSSRAPEAMGTNASSLFGASSTIGKTGAPYGSSGNLPSSGFTGTAGASFGMGATTTMHRPGVTNETMGPVSTFGTSGVTSGLSTTYGSGSTMTGTGIGSGATMTGAGIGSGTTMTGTGYGSGTAITGAGIGSGATMTGAGFGSGATMAGAGYGSGATMAGAGYGSGATMTGAGYGSGATMTGAGIGSGTTMAGVGYGSGATMAGAGYGSGAAMTGTGFGSRAAMTGTSSMMGYTHSAPMTRNSALDSNNHFNASSVSEPYHHQSGHSSLFDSSMARRDFLNSTDHGMAERSVTRIPDTSINDTNLTRSVSGREHNEPSSSFAFDNNRSASSILRESAAYGTTRSFPSSQTQSQDKIAGSLDLNGGRESSVRDIGPTSFGTGGFHSHFHDRSRETSESHFSENATKEGKLTEIEELSEASGGSDRALSSEGQGRLETESRSRKGIVIVRAPDIPDELRTPGHRDSLRRAISTDFSMAEGEDNELTSGHTEEFGRLTKAESDSNVSAIHESRRRLRLSRAAEISNRREMRTDSDNDVHGSQPTQQTSSTSSDANKTRGTVKIVRDQEDEEDGEEKVIRVPMNRSVKIETNQSSSNHETTSDTKMARRPVTIVRENNNSSSYQNDVEKGVMSECRSFSADRVLIPRKLEPRSSNASESSTKSSQRSVTIVRDEDSAGCSRVKRNDEDNGREVILNACRLERPENRESIRNRNSETIESNDVRGERVFYGDSRFIERNSQPRKDDNEIGKVMIPRKFRPVSSTPSKPKANGPVVIVRDPMVNWSSKGSKEDDEPDGRTVFVKRQSESSRRSTSEDSHVRRPVTIVREPLARRFHLDFDNFGSLAESLTSELDEMCGVKVPSWDRPASPLVNIVREPYARRTRTFSGDSIISSHSLQAENDAILSALRVAEHHGGRGTYHEWQRRSGSDLREMGVSDGFHDRMEREASSNNRTSRTRWPESRYNTVRPKRSKSQPITIIREPLAYRYEQRCEREESSEGARTSKSSTNGHGSRSSSRRAPVTIVREPQARKQKTRERERSYDEQEFRPSRSRAHGDQSSRYVTFNNNSQEPRHQWSRTHSSDSREDDFDRARAWYY